VKAPSVDDRIILIRQYRPPLAAYTIELPAGLVDPGETAESTAERELKEETGYSGKSKGTSIDIAVDPGLSNANHKYVIVEVSIVNTKKKKKTKKEKKKSINISCSLFCNRWMRVLRRTVALNLAKTKRSKSNWHR
jgi:ADP-ribose pyrophosphatase